MSKDYFTDVEDAFIIENYPFRSVSAIGKHLNRAKSSIVSRIIALEKRGLISEYTYSVKDGFRQTRSNYDPNTDRIPNLTQRTWLSI